MQPTTDASSLAGSSSLSQPDYWWYRARTELLHTALGKFLGRPQLLLDVGSADGPSIAWMRGDHRRIAMDIDPRGLEPGEGVCASALSLPFADSSFDVVAAFDVVEHCEPEDQALSELCRVLRPGGRMLLSVPAYQWAWSDHDVRAGHYRRYTRPRIVAAVQRAGVEVERATYAFASVLPLFAAERFVRRAKRSLGRGQGERAGGLPTVSPLLDKALTGLSQVDNRLLRSRDLPFGSSIFVAGIKPE